MNLSKVTDNELRLELKKRGWCMIIPVNIKFDADYILDRYSDENE